MSQKATLSHAVKTANPTIKSPTPCDRDGINRRIVRDSLVEMTDAVCPKWKGAHRT